MMQYISHEVRTPLNTAFIGENLITSTGEKMLTMLKQILHNLKGISTIQHDEDHMLMETCIEQLSNSISDIRNILETAAFIKESCELSLKVLNDTLTFDKIDGNMVVLEIEEVDLIRFVDELLNPFKSHPKNSSIKFSSDFIGLFDASSRESFDWFSRYILKADKIKLRQVMKNILSNAVKFTKSGEIKIVVEIKKPCIAKASYVCYDFNPKKIIENQSTVRISVIDTGCGVSLEQQPTIFDQYVQFNVNKMQQGSGTGLGLWIARSIYFNF
jgi:signal transduction histidine kinase